MREHWLDPNTLPFGIEGEIGQIAEAALECPGVYYVATKANNSLFSEEYYIVTPEADMISDRARQYGTTIDSEPDLRLYRLDEPGKGRRIIDYEVNRYRVKNKLSLPPQTSLYEIALYAMEDNPEYFGEYPVPIDTPWGRITRHKKVGNGVYWLETERSAETLAVSYPYTLEFSDSVMRTARFTAVDSKRGIDNTLGYTFFTKPDICLAVFELMATRPEWRKRVDEAALMNAIWTYHPEYAASHNLLEQSGLNDYFSMLMAAFDMDVEPKCSPDRLIKLFPDIGEDFLLFDT